METDFREAQTVLEIPKPTAETAAVETKMLATADVAAAEPDSAASSTRWLFIPLALVSAVFLIGLLVRWRGRESVTPQDLVRDLGDPAKSHWHQAYALAELLRGPQQASLRQDARLAAELAVLLDRLLEAGPFDANRIKLRVFLCRALGEFAVPGVQPVLVRASRLERDPAELAVRRSAVEALAAHMVRSPAPDRDPALLAALLAAAGEHGEAAVEKTLRAELRASAAFALGVLGGDPALQQLQFMLADPQTNVRYNAAIGLARHGHAAALPVLLEMLQPNNPQTLAGETSAAGRRWKQAVVLTNAIRAAQCWAEQNSPADRRPLTTAIESLLLPGPRDASVTPAVQQQARQTLSALATRPSFTPRAAEESTSASTAARGGSAEGDDSR
jgi:hypothetical protein